MAKSPRADAQQGLGVGRPDNNDQASEIDAFFPVPKSVTTVTGEELLIGKVTWGIQLRVARALGNVLSELPPGIGTVDEDGKIQTGELSMVLPILFDKAPAAMTEICASVLAKDAEWVEANLELDSVLEIVVPFSRRILEKMGGLAATSDLLQGQLGP